MDDIKTAPAMTGLKRIAAADGAARPDRRAGGLRRPGHGRRRCGRAAALVRVRRARRRPGQRLRRRFEFFAPDLKTLQVSGLGLPALRPGGPLAGVAARAHGGPDAAGARAARQVAARCWSPTAPALMQRVPPREIAARRPATRPRSARDVDIADARALLRRQRLPARLDRFRARRVRHPRRGDRRLPAGRGGAGAARPVRRHPGIDPRLRSGDPALDPPAEARSTSCRSARRCSTPTASPASAKGYVAALRRVGRRSALRRGQRGRAARPGSSTGCRCSTTGSRPCSTICRPDALIGARPPGRGGARRAPGDDRRRLRRARQTRRDEGAALPRAASPTPLYLTDDGVGRAAGRPAAAPLQPVPAREATGVVDLGARLGPQLRRRAGPGQRQPVRGRRRPRRRRWPRPASGCCSPPGRTARPSAWARMLADHGLKDVALRARLAGGARRLGPEEAAARGAAARQRLRDRQPGGHLRDRHPGRPPGAPAPAPAGRRTSWPRPPR